MKKLLLLLSVLFVVSCSSDTEELAPVIKYTLTTSVNPSTAGTITPASGQHIEGTIVELTASANEFYIFSGWEGNDSNENSIRIQINSDLEITANFESTLELYSEFTDISEANVSSKGPFAIWWDKRYSIEYENLILEMLLKSRNKIINELGFLDPVNIEKGKLINIYLHQTGTPDIFDQYNWNASMRGGEYGPYVTMPYGKYLDQGYDAGTGTLLHENFHIYQSRYFSNIANGNDWAWYIETTAKWFELFYNNYEESFVEVGSLTNIPHVALWHKTYRGSQGNGTINDPQTWTYEVHQYALHAFLFYLTEIKGVNPNIITRAFLINSGYTPQEYYFNEIPEFRAYFADWAAANTSNLNYLTREQVERSNTELQQYGGDDIGFNDYSIEVDGNNANGTFSPSVNLKPRSWAYNVVKVNNSANKSFNISFNGEENGSEGAISFFELRIVKKADENNYITTNFEIENGLTGNKTVTLNENEDEFYIVVVSVPEYFSGNQNYNYSISISE
jgi:hypothetical protein